MSSGVPLPVWMARAIGIRHQEKTGSRLPVAGKTKPEPLCPGFSERFYLN